MQQKKVYSINELSCENVYIACEMSSLENQMSLKSDDPNYYAHGIMDLTLIGRKLEFLTQLSGKGNNIPEFSFH